MEITICGMTLEEVEENFRKFEKMREKNWDHYTREMKPLGLPVPDKFTPDEENAFVDKIYDEVEKAYHDLYTAETLSLSLMDIDCATEEEKDKHETLCRMKTIIEECDFVKKEEKEIKKKHGWQQIDDDPDKPDTPDKPDGE